MRAYFDWLWKLVAKASVSSSFIPLSGWSPAPARMAFKIPRAELDYRQGSQEEGEQANAESYAVSHVRGETPPCAFVIS